jgi:hypothetical protein
MANKNLLIFRRHSVTQMNSISRFLVLVILISLVACDRSTLDYAGVKQPRSGTDAPDYTVQPNLNQPTKTK